MSGYDKTHRPERDLATHDAGGERVGGSKDQAAEAGPVQDEARMWRALGASRVPRSPSDAAALAVEQRGGGQAVDPAIAQAVSAQTGAGLDDVRVHTDPISQAATRAMNARAFTVGADIFLGPGESATNPELIAHELTHVVQQRGGRATPQRKIAIGDAKSPAEADADRVANRVTAGAAPTEWLVDNGPLASGQMLKTTFLEHLQPQITSTASEELGRLGSAVACPYIADYFAKYSALPASASIALIRKWIPIAAGAASAQSLIPLILQRVRSGVHQWKETGKLPPDLAAAEPAMAQKAEQQPQQAQRKSLDSMEAQLGPGEEVDSKTAAPMRAEGARVHRGPAAAAQAAEHGAVAFAVGQNVVMGANAPAQGTPAGDALLAHELAHTAQQRDAASDPQARQKPIGGEDQAAERDADRATADAASKEKLATLGNFAGRMGDVMKTGLQLQRCPSNEGPKSIDMAGYLKAHEVEIAATAAQHLKTLDFATGDPNVQFIGKEQFRTKLGELLTGPDTPGLDSLVRPDRIGEIVDTSRVLDEEGSAKGPDKYFQGVGYNIGNALARRIHESLHREIPRYTIARLKAGPKVAVNDIPTSHPIDPLVITALGVGGVLNIDGEKFIHAHPEYAKTPAKTQLRDVTLTVEQPDRW